MQIHKFLRTCGDKFKIMHNKNTHWGVVARAEFGAPGRGCFSTATVILFYRTAHLNDEHAVLPRPLRSQNSWLEVRVSDKLTASSRPDRSPDTEPTSFVQMAL
ncbi:hypothetical protein Zmor_013600 [Zophobas morio]|uniref:Uncharacterized protein n=1 Tax=Zophobas morio TaxID=2755281 RepID=A0AA38MES2_9CUCU|nr:hypothetical protein Zmor_013600 [Zophobas morio]